MKESLFFLTDYAVILINGMALIVIVFGTIQAFICALWFAISPQSTRARDIWLRYGRWLVAGLTFQLAADIIETSLVPSWEELGKLAAIAAIRTALNYFLERDMTEIELRKEA